jgi:uncharacterized protein (DUF2235 family)
MANKRNIILLSDGTGNSASNLFKTNVRRLYEALDLADPGKLKHPRQFAYYDDGVGTSSFRPLAILGGAFGFGLARNVRDLYAFLCRTYRPGDRIYAFGFSRGAFTVRVAIGLIVSQGILFHDGDEATLARNVRAAYREYRREKYGWRLLTFLWRAVRDDVARDWWALRRFTPISEVQRHWIGKPNDKDAALKGAIKFVGVWDTVDAYGLPIQELTRAVDALVVPLTMPDAQLAEEVRRARHALSLDDQRNTFHPRLWNEEGETDPNRIRQVWFAGVHADVGGGYPDDGLAHVTLRWMMDEAVAAMPGEDGLRFLEEVRRRQLALADENAPLHDSRRGLASYYRYKPRRVSELVRQREGAVRKALAKSYVHLRPGRDPGEEACARRDYNVVAKPVVHQSVLRRIEVAQDGYAPISLPASFRVQMIGGGAKELEEGDVFLWGDGAKPGDQMGSTGPEASVAPAASTDQGDFSRRLEHVWNHVWWRRIAYFATLIGTLFLASLPLWMEVKGCGSWACFASPWILSLDYLLPGFASTWVKVFASNPGTFLLGASVIVLTTVMGKRLDTRIPDEMRRLWYLTRLRPRRPNGMAPFKSPEEPGRVNVVVQTLRTNPRYKRFWKVATRYAFPFIAMMATGFALLGGVNTVVLSARESFEGICGKKELTTEGSPFRTSSICYQAHAEITAGSTYRIRVTIPSANPGEPEEVEDNCQPKAAALRHWWWDCSMPATPNGIVRGEAGHLMPLFVPFRRHIGEPWYKLMARIGKDGSDVYSPEWRLLPVQVEGRPTYEALLRARRSGPLYIYVNDAAPVVYVTWFYAGNNRGTADVSVTLVDRDEP